MDKGGMSWPRYESPYVLALWATVLLLMPAVVVYRIVTRSSPPLRADKPRLLRLERSDKLNHNTRLFRFALPRASDTLGLPTGKHVVVAATVPSEQPNGSAQSTKRVERKYTPVSSASARGYFELLIKVYPAPGGLMSRHLDSLSVGQYAEFRGPYGRFEYERGKYRCLGMIAGGTGITPMWQVINAVLDDPSDQTMLRLIFANVTESDILLRSELDALVQKHSSRLTVFHVLNKPPAGWRGGEGFVSEQHIREHIAASPEAGLQTLLCGPLPMCSAMRKHLAAIGFDGKAIFNF